ncbi:sodium/potassium/calcium exchanger 2-like isoform X2 [Silurus meridionalis]|uniref:sodium/potassium/calcium exchanger 2-like isoform X2 n=1 Tax=Silurus meridionalis TaxID=175797 RepID=UPI001EECA10C|nr:sodium/potassium/calcium exchanger 2-like isoform X2 [Silurus meridionalis]
MGQRSHPVVRRKLRSARVLALLLGILAISSVSFSVVGAFFSSPFSSTQSETPHAPAPHRTLLSVSVSNASGYQGDYPEDLFTLEQRRQGAVILHMLGMLYMFIALALVCDEFFVPALTVITEKLAISDDVAGATFMAAGGSAPELFTSVIGVFISHSNVGIGTIVGSAVFNILFVIGMCAVFSREILNLTWWPLFRDVSFYILDLIMLIVFFLDNYISCWESITLLLAYAAYVLFMKFNSQVEGFVKGLMNRNQVVEVAETQPKVSPVPTEDESKLSIRAAFPHQQALLPTPSPLHPITPFEHGSFTSGCSDVQAKPRLQRGGSSASLHNSLMRNSIFQLMIHTLDPLSEEFADSGKFREKASILHKIAKKKCQVEDANGVADKNLPNSSSVEVEVSPPLNGSAGQEGDAGDEDEEEDQPLTLSWPESNRKRFTYLFLLPIVFPLWITLPDARKPTSKKFFPITFLGAICWIACFSYLMVWLAHQVGETIGITEEIMGLTILAAGTSIPDLITSVIVARKGLGDMAVSSSVGSNIFDITVGLPFPWLMYTLANGLRPVAVSSNGLFCAIVLLFIMLLFVIISIAACKWKMSKLLGFIMFLLYIVFLVVSVMLEDKIIVCPISI